MLVRKIASVCLCVAILIASSGAVPVWVFTPSLPVAKLDTGGWWPCRHHACGCMSPQICRTSCRCFKHVQPAKSSLASASCCSGNSAGGDAPELLQPLHDDSDAGSVATVGLRDRVTEPIAKEPCEPAQHGRLALRSATCAGQSSAFVLARGTDWLVERPLVDIQLSPTALVIPDCSPLHEPLASAPVPPPPRPLALACA